MHNAPGQQFYIGRKKVLRRELETSLSTQRISAYGVSFPRAGPTHFAAWDKDGKDTPVQMMSAKGSFTTHQSIANEM